MLPAINPPHPHPSQCMRNPYKLSSKLRSPPQTPTLYHLNPPSFLPSFDVVVPNFQRAASHPKTKLRVCITIYNRIDDFSVREWDMLPGILNPKVISKLMNGIWNNPIQAQIPSTIPCTELGVVQLSQQKIDLQPTHKWIYKTSYRAELSVEKNWRIKKLESKPLSNQGAMDKTQYRLQT